MGVGQTGDWAMVQQQVGFSFFLSVRTMDFLVVVVGGRNNKMYLPVQKQVCNRHGSVPCRTPCCCGLAEKFAYPVPCS